MDEDDDEDAACLAAVAGSVVCCHFFESNNDNTRMMTGVADDDYRNTPRAKRRKFDHERALECIMDDYLRPDALFGSEFRVFFAFKG